MFSKATDGKTFIVCGFVPKDAEYKQVGDKNSGLTKFSIKCDEKTNPDGTTTPIWTNCECWHSVARYAANIKKGDTVFATGIIKTDEWTDKTTGELKKAKKLVCEFLSIMPGSSIPQTAPVSSSPPTPQPVAENTNVRMEMTETDDDYPF